MRGPGFLATSVVVVPAVALSHPAPATPYNACLGTRGVQERCTWTAGKVELDWRLGNDTNVDHGQYDMALTYKDAQNQAGSSSLTSIHQRGKARQITTQTSADCLPAEDFLRVQSMHIS
jgi:hypothetical protein